MSSFDKVAVIGSMDCALGSFIILQSMGLIWLLSAVHLDVFQPIVASQNGGKVIVSTVVNRWACDRNGIQEHNDSLENFPSGLGPLMANSPDPHFAVCISLLWEPKDIIVNAA